MSKETAAVLLVDLSSIAHPIWHMSGSEPDPDHTSQRTVAAVLKLAADHPYTAICCDSPNSFRKELDPTYKANRPPAEAPLHHQIDLAREALEADGFPVWQVDGFEGDDLIATATKYLIDDLVAGRDVLIASADKDLLALVGEKVEVLSTRTGELIGPAEVLEKVGVDPGLVVDYLTLVGDSSDNIAGAKGIGPKSAVALLDTFGSVDNIYYGIDFASDHGDESGLKPAQLASLEELRPRLAGVRSLVRMRTDVPLDIAAVFKARVPKVAETFMEDETNEEPEPKKITGSPTGSPLQVEVPRDEAVKPAGSVDIQDKITPKLDKMEAQVALVDHPAPAEWERSLEPRSMMEARSLSKWMFESRMFSDYGSQQAVLSTMLLGRELGLPAMAALRSVHVIEGKHSLSADLMVALVLKSGIAEYFQLVDSTDVICTYETHRKGAPNPMRLSYTIQQADQAGLLFVRPKKQPGAWHKIPTQMLRARCKSELARLEYPDLLAGLYTPEELHDAKGNGA